MINKNAMEYAEENFPELDFETKLKIVAAYLDGCIDATVALTGTVRESRKRLEKDADEECITDS